LAMPSRSPKPTKSKRSTLFLAETLTPMQWVGIFLALLGGVMLSYETEGSGGATA